MIGGRRGIVGRAGNWRDRRVRTEGPPPRPKRFRPERSRPPHAESGEVIARLDRLESVVLAIAAHLGIEPEAARRGGTSGGDSLREGDRRDARESRAADAHEIVRTVARRLSGRIKVYHPERGYGFVLSSGEAGEVFFHRSDCRTDPATLEPSAVVTFDLAEMANGHVKAVNLTPRS
jgi:cold shock CspA family protein